MYTFVFLWTPALSPAGEDIPHGLIFATFMVSCMVGGSGHCPRRSTLPTLSAPQRCSCSEASPTTLCSLGAR